MNISLLRITVIIKRYVININNANSEVRKSLNEVVNKRIHQILLTLQISLFVNEHYYLLLISKPYLGIHPKVVNIILSKKKENFKIT